MKLKYIFTKIVMKPHNLDCHDLHLTWCNSFRVFLPDIIDGAKMCFVLQVTKMIMTMKRQLLT